MSPCNFLLSEAKQFCQELQFRVMQFLPVSYMECHQISFKNGSATFWKQAMRRLQPSILGWKDLLQLDRCLYFSVFINLLLFWNMKYYKNYKNRPCYCFLDKVSGNVERNYIIFKLIASCIVNGEICYLYDRIRIPILFLPLVKVSTFSLKKCKSLDYSLIKLFQTLHNSAFIIVK